MKKQNIKNIESIKFISANIFSSYDNPRCGLDVSLKLAPILYFLYKDHMVINPNKPKWFNRDRLLFGQAYAAPALYSTLYHFGFSISKKDLEKYTIYNSKLPMIPEHLITPGVDATIYPLGQDVGQGAGLALAQKFVKKNLDNKINPYTYMLCTDESFQNGYSYEAMSFAGHFKLNNLIIINVSTVKKSKIFKSTFSDDMKLRAQSCGFNFKQIKLDKIDEFEKDFSRVIKEAKSSQKPTFIDIDVDMIKEITLEELKCYLKPMDDAKWKKIESIISPKLKKFQLLKTVKDSFDKIKEKKLKEFNIWNEKIGIKLTGSKKFKNLLKTNRSKIDMLKHFQPQIGMEQMIYQYQVNGVKITSQLSTQFLENGMKQHYIKKHKMLNVDEKLSKLLPSFINGTGEVLTVGPMQGHNLNFNTIYEKNIVYGVRDNTIPSIVSGMAYFEGMNPAFFIDAVWLDYALAGLRSSAMMQQNILAILNYEYRDIEKLSLYHQIVDQIAILRSTPNLIEWKPIDAHEGILAYNMYLKAKGHPTVILLRNEVVKTISDVKEKDFAKGAYILKPELVKNFKTVICSGGEMEYVYEAFKDKKDVRIISMPSVSTFRKQSSSYKKELIPNYDKTYFIENSNDRSTYEFAKYVFGIRDDIYLNKTKSIILSTNKLKKIIK